jgi:RNA polymerase sigma-70 factor, ECF subfamily
MNGPDMEPHHHDAEEEALRDAVVAGSESAWRALYERNFAAVHAYVFHSCGRRADRAEEIVQETWLVAVRRIADFDPRRAAFESWLKGIAEHVLKNHRRRWMRDRPASSSSASADRLPPEPAQLSEEGQVDARELVALALTALPAGYQAVLKAKYHQCLSVAQIASEGGKTTKSVESLLSRARAALREACQRLGGDQP